MNPKIEQIEAAEAAITTFTAEERDMRSNALQDGVIDADELSDLDRLASKIDQLRDVIRSLRATLEENRRIWDALQPALAEWREQLAALRDAGKPGLAQFDTAETEMNAAVADQRWADATQVFTATRTAITPVYAALLAEVPVGPGAPVAPTANPDQDQWASVQARYTQAITALERHTQAAHAVIAAEITATKGSAAAAVTLANGGDFASAVAAMTPLIAACAATEEKAHNVAHYTAVLAQRTTLVNDPSSAPVGDAAIDDMQTEMATLLADAATDATAGNFGDGILKLDRIPPIFDRKRALNLRRTQYLPLFNNITTDIASIDAAAAADRAPLQAQIDRFKAEFVAAQYARTNDYSDSVARLRALQGEFTTLLAVVQSSAGYTAALTAFDVQLAVLEPHPGRVAIEEFFQAKTVDRAQAVADAAATRFPVAINLLQRTPAAAWTAQKAIADAYVTYAANRQTAQTLIDTVRAMPDTADLIAQADALMVTASNQAVAKDIAAAELSVADAQTRANDAKTASEAQAALGALHDEGALDGAAADFPAALAVFTNMRGHVVAQDGTGSFVTEIAEADTPVGVATAEAAKAAPDPTVLRTNLDAGIAVLMAVLPKIIAQGLYQTHLAAAQTLVNANLPPLSVDDCIKPAIDACTALITEAEALAATPGRDFAGAEAKLNQVMERGRQAQTNAGLYAGIAADRTTINAALATIAGSAAGVVTLLAATTARLNGLLTDITAAIAAEDFTLAAAKGTEGAGVSATTAQDVGHCTNIDANYANWVTNRIAQIQGGQPEVAAALAETTQRISDYNDCLTAGTYGGAWNITNQLYWCIQRGIDALALAGPYNTAQTATRTKLDAIVAVRNPGIEERLTALEERYTAAVALGAEPQYVIATTKMNEIATESDALLPIAQAFGTYTTARTAAETKLVEAETHAQLDAIQTIVTRLRGKFTSAEQVANDGDPARAQTMMDEVKAGAEDAIGNADNSGIFADIAEAIGDSSSDTGGPSILHVAAARTAYAWQAGKDNASVASTELAQADTELNTAENSATPPADQTTALRNAMDLVTEAGQIISQHTLLIEALAMARTRIAQIRAHAQAAYMASQLGEAETAVDNVQASATDLAALPGCSADLETIMTDLVAMVPKLDAQGEYVTLRPTPEVEPRLAVLEAHEHSYAIQSDIERIRSKLAEAARLSENFDPIPAVALLNEVKDIGHSAFILAEMRANTPPSPADLQEILSRPDGQAELDAMVDALEPDAQRAVLQVAFEARFGCTLQNFLTQNAAGTPTNPIAPGAQDGPNIRRFYEIMSDLPATDTLENDSMRVFTEVETGQGSRYSGTRKDVVMREGDAALSSAYTFGQEHQVGEVEPGCEPANDDPVSFFSWNTLHEVGHAVDDQHGFMDGRQSGDPYGGWTVYGSNVEPIATIVAAHFDYDKTYIQQAMSRALATPTTPAEIMPAAPTNVGCSPEEWEGRRVEFATWLAQVRTGRNPWNSQSTAQQIAIGGIIYQESYNGTWTSYKLAARSRGITSYQFRAPGEWFSELYAAFHSGKIQNGHPSAPWLQELAGPDD